MKRYSKKEIKLVPTEDLSIRYCRILERAELLEAEDIPVADAREILWIEDELRKRVIKGVGHDFYPPDRIEEETLPKNYIKSVLGPTIKPELKPGRKIKFPITVTSSVGTKVATFTVEANTKDEANLLARKQIHKLGLRGATHKIS